MKSSYGLMMLAGAWSGDVHIAIISEVGNDCFRVWNATRHSGGGWWLVKLPLPGHAGTSSSPREQSAPCIDA